jgi:AcrR family transcriptional regulator
MNAEIDPAVVNATIALARESQRDIAEISLDEIARYFGVSRMTLYRRIGSRQQLEAAVRAAGVEPGGRPSVRDRAPLAAAEIIREAGITGLTLDAVAVRAGCSISALHDQFAGRDGLLRAVFDRYHPLPRIERLLANPPADFCETVHQILAVVYDTVTAEPALLRALLAEALARPDSPTVHHLAQEFVPRAMGSLIEWLGKQIAAGHCRPWPLPVLAQALLAPMIVHATTRDLLLPVAGGWLPARAEAIECFSQAFCAAVALPAPA